MTSAHHVKKARKNYKDAGIKKGQEYWWWKFRFGSIHRSTTPPRPSQLTNSEHLRNLYSVQEAIEDLTPEDIVDGFLDDILSQLQDVYDTCDSNRSNMPDHLQDVGSGEILQQYMDAAENYQQELEGVEVDVDEDSIREQAESKFDEDDLEDGQDREDWIEDKFQELLEERQQEIIDALQACTLEI